VTQVPAAETVLDAPAVDEWTNESPDGRCRRDNDRPKVFGFVYVSATSQPLEGYVTHPD